MVVALSLLLTAWLVLVVVTWTRRRRATSPPARKLVSAMNVAVLVLGVATGFGACAAPIVSLVGAFDEVAELPIEEKTPGLNQRIEKSRLLIEFSAIGIPIVIGAIVVFTTNRRGLRRATDGDAPSS